jgi:thymidylate synthase
MLNALKEYYPELQYGNYYHFVDSFHVYERHFKMLDKLRNSDSYDIVKCPKISGPDEVKFLKNQNYKVMKPSSNFEFTKWLTEQQNRD